MVPNLVLADNGLFYKNPIIAGDGWFICWDDDDPDELVVANDCKLTPTEIFEQTGLDAKVTRKAGRSGRLFDDTFNFKPSQAYWITIHSPIPANKITRHDGTIPQGEQFTMECVFDDFSTPR